MQTRVSYPPIIARINKGKHPSIRGEGHSSKINQKLELQELKDREETMMTINAIGM